VLTLIELSDTSVENTGFNLSEFPIVWKKEFFQRSFNVEVLISYFLSK
jgi:hypothetical protein